jgi:hypothetical protein
MFLATVLWSTSYGHHLLRASNCIHASRCIYALAVTQFYEGKVGYGERRVSLAEYGLLPTDIDFDGAMSKDMITCKTFDGISVLLLKPSV